MGKFRRLSLVDALDSYLTEEHDEEKAVGYRILFAKVLDEYNWNQLRRYKLLDKLDEKFSSYKNGHSDMIDVLNKGEKRRYLNITKEIHKELSKIIKYPEKTPERIARYIDKVYNKFESLVSDYFEM